MGTLCNIGIYHIWYMYISILHNVFNIQCVGWYIIQGWVHCVTKGHCAMGGRDILVNMKDGCW